MSSGFSIKVEGLKENPTDAFVLALERRFQYIGERAVAEARSKTKQNDWHDVTGNLRSSIGYVVLRDGRPIYQSKEEGASGGSAKARELLSRLSQGFPQGLVLIVCAGMEYATFVEARGYNVTSSAELIARDLVDKLLEQLKNT